MATTPHVLEDDQVRASLQRRLKRAQGQVGAIVQMLEDERNCEDIVVQLAAASKALNTAALTLLAASLKECLRDGTTNGDVVAQRLQRLFLSLA
jgi:DNA-binding FrmR family transcriptional regulator